MTKVLTAHFSPELVALMKPALDTAVVDRSQGTPATKPKMAPRIIKTAAEGITVLHTLMSAAVDVGSGPAE
jgi:hypothetical protein